MTVSNPSLTTVSQRLQQPNYLLRTRGSGVRISPGAPLPSFVPDGHPAQRHLIKAIQAERQFPRVAIFHKHGRAIDRNRRELLPVAASLGSSRTIEDANRWREQCAFTVGHANAFDIAIGRGPVLQCVRLVGKIGAIYILERKLWCRQSWSFAVSFAIQASQTLFSTAIIAAVLGSGATLTFATALSSFFDTFSPAAFAGEGGFLGSRIGS